MYFRKLSFMVVVSMLVGVLSLSTVSAHEGHTHESKGTVKSVTPAEQIVLLQKIIELLRTLHQLTTQQSIAVPAPIQSNDTQMDDHMENMHHEDADHETVADTVGKKLVIEVETHMGKTHVHVRKPDAPEDMFFVDASIDATDALVAAIVARSGIADADVRAALVYFE